MAFGFIQCCCSFSVKAEFVVLYKKTLVIDCVVGFDLTVVFKVQVLINLKWPYCTAILINVKKYVWDLRFDLDLKS